MSAENSCFSEEKKERLQKWLPKSIDLTSQRSGSFCYRFKKSVWWKEFSPKKHKEKNYNPHNSFGAYSICGWYRQWTGCWEMELFWGINRGIKTKTVCEENTKRRSFRISILSTTAIIIIILATVLADNITITYFQEHLVILIRLDLVRPCGRHPELR